MFMFTTPVSFINDRLVTTTRHISERIGSNHNNLMNLVESRLSELQEFGPVDFEVELVYRPYGDNTPTRYALLNEPQAALVISLYARSGEDRAFGKLVAKDFKRCNRYPK